MYTQEWALNQETVSLYTQWETIHTHVLAGTLLEWEQAGGGRRFRAAVALLAFSWVHLDFVTVFSGWHSLSPNWLHWTWERVRLPFHSSTLHPPWWMWGWMKCSVYLAELNKQYQMGRWGNHSGFPLPLPWRVLSLNTHLIAVSPPSTTLCLSACF